MNDDEKRADQRPGAAINLDEIDRATYLRIKKISSRYVRQRVNPTLSATAVANEVWIRLKSSTSALQVRSPDHFDALIGQTAGYVAGDSARRRLSKKRDGGLACSEALDHQAARQASIDTILLISQTLAELEIEDAATAAMLKERYFEGLTVAEIATKREISVRSVERGLKWGRTWIHERVTATPEPR